MERVVRYRADVASGVDEPAERPSDYEARERFLSMIASDVVSEGVDGWQSRLDDSERGLSLVIELPGFAARCFPVTETLDRELIASPFPAQGHRCIWVEVRRVSEDRVYDAFKAPSNGAVVRFLKDLDRREVDAAVADALQDEGPGPTIAAALPPTVEELRSPIVRKLMRWKSAAAIDVEIDPLGEDGSAAVRDSALAALSRVDIDLVRTNFPRNAQGNAELATTVLLAELDGPPPARGRQWWLVASGPRRRSDPQLISIGVATARRFDARHRWDRTAWLWDRSVDNPWRTFDRALTQLGPIGASEPSAVDPRIAAAERSMIAQDQGRFDEAFDAYDLRVGGLVQRFLDCLPPPGLLGEAMSFIDHALCHWDPEPWCRRAFETLWRLDPRRATDAIDAAYADARRAAATNARRRFRSPHLTLATMPNQIHVRKARLVLVANPDGGDKRVDIEVTGSDETIPRSEWERPFSVDFLRARSDNAPFTG